MKKGKRDDLRLRSIFSRMRSVFRPASIGRGSLYRLERLKGNGLKETEEGKSKKGKGVSVDKGIKRYEKKADGGKRKEKT